MYGKKWAEAVEQMHITNYAWDDHFSKHTLRALLIQQCGDDEDKRKMTLQEYVGMHPVPTDESSKMAGTLYPNDEKAKTKFVYEVRKNRRYAVAGHHQHKEHHHAHAPGAMPAADGMGPSGVPTMGYTSPRDLAGRNEQFGTVARNVLHGELFRDRLGVGAEAGVGQLRTQFAGVVRPVVHLYIYICICIYIYCVQLKHTMV